MGDKIFITIGMIGLVVWFIFIVIKYILPLILIFITWIVIPGLILRGVFLVLQYFNKD